MEYAFHHQRSNINNMCMMVWVYVYDGVGVYVCLLYAQDSILSMGAATSPLELRLAVANGLHAALPNVVYMSVYTCTCRYTLVLQSSSVA